jgi:16S rRNA (cytosine967-C5)-methyltransferase
LAETSIHVADIQRKYSQMQQVAVDEFLPSSLTNATRDGAMSLWTHKHGTDAMYLALFQKSLG